MKSVSVPTHLNTEISPILGMVVIIVWVNDVLKSVGDFMGHDFVYKGFLVVLQILDIKTKFP